MGNAPKPGAVTLALLVVCVLGVLGALGLFSMVNAGMFARYDIVVGMRMGGPSPLIALIPLGIGVAAGIGAAITWTIEKNQRA